jgi:F0F1-type ATP synthase membrane subunit c/vacuolar-type H+-ATPase subunit K
MLKLIIASAIVSISLVGTGIFIGVIYKNTVSNMAENCISQ